jgi:predicted DNA-binding WGR domain protein
MNLTHHAEQRMQQRAIPELGIELLSLYGRIEHSHGGASIHYFDRKSWCKAERAIRDLVENLDRVRDMYFVQGDEAVIVTAGHRTERVKRDYKPAHGTKHR